MEVFRERKPSFGVVSGLLSTAGSVGAKKINAGQRQLSSIQGDFRVILLQSILSSRETLQNKGYPSFSFCFLPLQGDKVMQEGTPDDILLSDRTSELASERVYTRVKEFLLKQFMSKGLKASLVLNRRPLDSLSHS